MKSNKLPASTAKDVFSYLLAIIMFYTGVIFFLTLIFQYINVQFPDALTFSYVNSLDLIRQAIAALVVVWPVYMLMAWLIQKEILAHKEKQGIWVRKWLLYLTLFVAAITIVIDLVTLIYNFLGGELTERFALKVVAVLFVAVAVFGYEFWDLRRDATKKSHIPMRAAVGSSVVILVAIVAGFFVVGSPAHQRAVRFDEQRVQNLSEIQYRVVNYWQSKETMPQNLAALSDALSGFSAPTDPRTGQPYEYRVTGNLQFEVCAVFETDVVLGIPEYSRAVMYPMYDGAGFDAFPHGIGRTCFSRTIDPDLYPPVEKFIR